MSVMLTAFASAFIALALSPKPLRWRERAPLSQPRAGYMAGVISGKLVLAGGSYWEGKQKKWSARVDVFDPYEDLWRASAPIPQPRSDAASVSLANALYVFGGGSNNIVRDDALTFSEGKWAQVRAAQLPEPRLYAVAVVCRGSIFLMGGLRTADDYSTASNTLWVWNSKQPQKGWREMPPLPGPGRISPAVTELDGKIYVFGGAAWDGVKGVRNLNDAYQFNPQDLKWTRLPDLPVARRCWWAVSIKHGILLLGGYTNTYAREIFVYDPALQTLRQEGMLPHAICDAKFFRIGDYIIGAGGESGVGVRAPWTLQAKLAEPQNRSKKP